MDPYNVVNRAVASKSDLKLLQGQVIAVHGRMLTVKLYDGIANHVPVIVSGIPKVGDVIWLLSDKGKLLCISPSSGALDLATLDGRYLSVNGGYVNGILVAPDGSALTSHYAVYNIINQALTKDAPNLFVSKVNDDVMAGSLRIDTPKGLALHSPGESVVALRAVKFGDSAAVSARSGWSGESEQLASVQCADPIGDQFAATQGWARAKFENPMLSGPHGPISSYDDITATTGSSTVFYPCLHHTSMVTGISRVVISGYSQIRNINAHSRASLTSFIFPYGYWHDGQPFAFTNNNTYEAQARHTETKKTGINSGDYGYQSFTLSAWFVNRPGARCSLGMQANTDYPPDGGASAQFGHMRISVMVYPHATFGAEDTPLWGSHSALIERNSG